MTNLPDKIPKKSQYSSPPIKARKNLTRDDYRAVEALLPQSFERLRRILADNDSSNKDVIEIAKFLIGLIYPAPKSIEVTDNTPPRTAEEASKLNLNIIQAVMTAGQENIMKAIRAEEITEGEKINATPGD